jgi:beta-lactamase superfamily II metal-dependent hydrolase
MKYRGLIHSQYLHILTPVSTPANIVAVPLCGRVLASNLASLLVTGWFPAAAECFNHAGWFLMFGAADIVITGLPAASEAMGEELLEAVQPRVIIVADSEFPASARASPRLRARLAQRGIPVLYTRSEGAVTLEFSRGRWELRTMSGLRLNSTARCSTHN